jgi:hypothetical protein
MYFQYMSSVFSGVLSGVGLEIPEGISELLSKLGSISVTTPNTIEELQEMKHHAVELYTETFTDISKDLAQGVLWVLPTAVSGNQKGSIKNKADVSPKAPFSSSPRSVLSSGTLHAGAHNTSSTASGSSRALRSACWASLISATPTLWTWGRLSTGPEMV